MKIITDCKQGDDTWHEYRLGSLGASSMSAVLACGKGRQDLLEKYALELITGEKTKSYQNQDMLDGLEAEPFIRAEYELFTGNKVDLLALVKSDISGSHCSPDGHVDEDGGLEIKKRIRKVQFSYAIARKKSWNNGWKDGKKQDRLTQGIPSNPEYIQVQTSLLVTKREWWDYCSAVVIFEDNPYSEKRKMRFDYAMGDYIIIQRVYRDEKLITEIKTETIRFLAELKILIQKMR